MAQYARKIVNFIASPNTDYSSGIEHEATDALTPDEYVVRQLIEVATTQQTFYLSHLTACTDLIIENTDATNYLLATVRVQKATKTFATNKIGFDVGGATFDEISATDADFLSALYFAAGDLAVVTGATDSGNNGTHFVAAAITDTLTVYPKTLTDTRNPDAGTPTVASQRDITVRLTAGQSVCLTNVLTASNLLLQANTAAVVAKISYAGT